jgi:hypothetical protein
MDALDKKVLAEIIQPGLQTRASKLMKACVWTGWPSLALSCVLPPDKDDQGKPVTSQAQEAFAWIFLLTLVPSLTYTATSALRYKWKESETRDNWEESGNKVKEWFAGKKHTLVNLTAEEIESYVNKKADAMLEELTKDPAALNREIETCRATFKFSAHQSMNENLHKLIFDGLGVTLPDAPRSHMLPLISISSSSSSTPSQSI